MPDRLTNERLKRIDKVSDECHSMVTELLALREENERLRKKLADYEEMSELNLEQWNPHLKTSPSGKYIDPSPETW